MRGGIWWAKGRGQFSIWGVEVMRGGGGSGGRRKGGWDGEKKGEEETILGSSVFGALKS